MSRANSSVPRPDGRSRGDRVAWRRAMASDWSGASRLVGWAPGSWSRTPVCGARALRHGQISSPSRMTLAELEPSAPPQAPSAGQLARVRGRIWVVGDVARDSQASLDGRPVQHLVSLVSVEDDATGEELEAV